jgi:hypothetical protein
MNEKDIFDGMKDALRKQLKEAYLEGANQGAISTCAIIYNTMTAVGLEEDNFLICMLKDIANQRGCEDLAKFSKLMRESKQEFESEGDLSDNLPPS